MKIFTILTLMLLSLGSYAQTPVEILKKSALKGGIIVHLGCGDASETANLSPSPRFVVHGLKTTDVTSARKNVRAKKLYGRVSIEQLTGSELPYIDNLINLIIVTEQGTVTTEEIMRVLTPLGKAYFKNGDSWKEVVKPWPKDMDQWTHYLHGADNNAVATDTQIGAPRSLNWISYPRWGRSHEEMASMSTAVTANGRIFFINDNAPLATIRFNGMWKLIAQDAFNGMKLWEKSIKVWNDHIRHFRSGPTHLPRRLVAIDDKVYVTLGLNAPVSCLDAATGKSLKVYAGTERTEEILVHDGHLYLMVGTSELKRFGGGLHERGEAVATKKRNIVVLNAESGVELWRKNARDADFVLPLSLTVKGTKVFFHSIKGLHCLDAKSGKPLWLAARPALAKRYGYSTSTLVVTDSVILLADRKVDSKEDKALGIAKDNVEYAVDGWTADGFSRHGKNELVAYSATDGKKLWTAPCKDGYNSPVDVFVINDVVWLGSKFDKGYDLKTGEIVLKLKNKMDPLGMAHHRCYRNKATTNFILSGNDGIETIDLKKGWTGNNSWIRGTCQYGILPANGLIYAPPDACACHPKAKLQGFVAVSSKLPKTATANLTPDNLLFVKGPAFSRLNELAKKTISNDAWPLYRHDKTRSGYTKTTVTGTNTKWQIKLGGKLTQPVIAHGKVYVASTDEHTIYALDRETGEKVWNFTAGGRIDSAPALYKGMVIFGSLDGWIYCLDGANGELAWRLQAAPEQRLVSVFGQLESTWPVHGSVLVQNDEITFTAGRSSYLDGGIYFYRLNPVTGKVLAMKPIRHLDPKTGKQTAKEGKKHDLKFDSEGTVSDILSGDGTNVFLKHMRFDVDGKEQPPTVPHLFCQTGFVGEEIFVRSYWVYGTNVGAGWGFWASMKSNDATIAPAGRIVSFNDKDVYGYGRIQHLAAAAGHTANATHLYSSVKIYKAAPLKDKKGKKGKKGKKKKGRMIKKYHWSKTAPFLVRAMVLTKDRLFVAGVPDVGKRNSKILQFDNNDEALDAFMGKKGAFLRTISPKTGEVTAEKQLSAPPIFDGLSVANGRIFISLKDGSVVCLGQ